MSSGGDNLGQTGCDIGAWTMTVSAMTVLFVADPLEARNDDISLDIYMRDFRAQDARTKAMLRKLYGEEGMKKHLDKDGTLLY